MLGQNEDSINNGVSCSVSECKYHGKGGICNAKIITVHGEKARRESDTLCATFKSKENE